MMASIDRTIVASLSGVSPQSERKQHPFDRASSIRIQVGTDTLRGNGPAERLSDEGWLFAARSWCWRSVVHTRVVDAVV